MRISIASNEPVAHLMAIKRMFGLGGYLHLVWELRQQQEGWANARRLYRYDLKRKILREESDEQSSH